MHASETSLWQLFTVAHPQEQDPDFRSVLADVLHTGLRQCGAIGLVGIVLYVGLGVLGLGYEVHWTYRGLRTSGVGPQIVATGTLIVAALSVGGLVLAQMECSLRTGRLFGLGAVVLSGAVAMFEGGMRGTFGTGSVVPMYLVVVAVVPFRPLQVLGIGGSVALIVYVLGPSGLAWTPSPALTAEMARHLAFVGGSAVLITGTSAALYRRHRAFALAQASLQKNRDLLRRVQSVAQVGGWEYDPAADTATGTEEVYQMLDLPLDATVDAQTGLGLYPPAARAELRDALDRCLHGREPFTLEAPVRTAEGEQRWVHVRGTARERYDGTVRLLGTVQDITERHEMETRLREREALLRSITENVNDGIYRIVPNEGLVYANEAFARMFGYNSAAAVLSVAPPDLYAAPDAQAPLFRAPEANTPDARAVEFQRSDGSTFTGLLGGTVVRDDGGAVRYVDGVVTDISALKAREAELQRERDRFETLFDNLPTPVVQGVVDDGQAQAQTINRAFEKTFGHDAQSVEGQAMCTLIGPDEDPASMSALIQRAFKSDRHCTEVTRPTPDGPRTFQLHFAARYREDQRTEGYVMFVDITERKRREQALREREQKAKALYTATERLLRADDEAAVADGIEALVRTTFDYPFSSVRLPAGAPTRPARVSPDVRTSLSDLVEEGTDPKAAVIRACRRGQTVVAHDLGSPSLPVRQHRLQAAAFLPIAGHGLLAIGTEADASLPEFDLRLLEILSTHASAVLDRIDQEQDLRRSERRFRGIFENAGIGIALLDAEGYVLESNPALQHMFGLSAEALRGRPLGAITRAFSDANLAQAAAQHNDLERQFLRDSGEAFWGSLTLTPHEGPGETQFIGMIEDIDARKRHKQQLKAAKEEAEEMNRLKSAFLANMSHEIRTPLTSILGFAEAIGEAARAFEDVDPPVAQFADHISQSGHRLLETLDSVLNLSQLEAGSMTLCLDTVELTDAVREIVDAFAPRAKAAGVALTLCLPDAPVRLRTDRGALRRIQRNLLSNALKYTEEGGQAWIRVRAEDNAAILEVEDTGIGMAPERVPTLFNAFEQASTGPDRSHEGSGLGLAIVDHLVGEMGGTIEVATEKGVGTCFTMRFPTDDSVAGESAE